MPIGIRDSLVLSNEACATGSCRGIPREFKRAGDVRVRCMQQEGKCCYYMKAGTRYYPKHDISQRSTLRRMAGCKHNGLNPCIAVPCPVSPCIIATCACKLMKQALLW
jgi:hypothetical protein